MKCAELSHVVAEILEKSLIITLRHGGYIPHSHDGKTDSIRAKGFESMQIMSRGSIKKPISPNKLQFLASWGLGWSALTLHTTYSPIFLVVS